MRKNHEFQKLFPPSLIKLKHITYSYKRFVTVWFLIIYGWRLVNNCQVKYYYSAKLMGWGGGWVIVMMFNATFSNISVILLRSVLLELEYPGKSKLIHSSLHVGWIWLTLYVNHVCLWIKTYKLIKVNLTRVYDKKKRLSIFPYRQFPFSVGWWCSFGHIICIFRCLHVLVGSFFKNL